MSAMARHERNYEARYQARLDAADERDAWAESRMGELYRKFMDTGDFCEAMAETEGAAEIMNEAWKNVRFEHGSEPDDRMAAIAMREIMDRAAQEWAEQELAKEEEEIARKGRIFR